MRTETNGIRFSPHHLRRWWTGKPRVLSFNNDQPGAGRSGFDEQLASFRPQTTAFLQPRIRLGYISMRAPGSQARERYANVDDGRWFAAAKG